MCYFRGFFVFSWCDDNSITSWKKFNQNIKRRKQFTNGLNRLDGLNRNLNKDGLNRSYLMLRRCGGESRTVAGAREHGLTFGWAAAANLEDWAANVRDAEAVIWAGRLHLHGPKKLGWDLSLLG
jgi:hypothetical protein